MKLRLLTAVALVLATVIIATTRSAYAAWLVLFLGAAALGSTQPLSARLCVTLTATEILGDVIKAFAKNFPAINRMGLDFRPTGLKLNQQYIAHIPTVPSVDDVSTTYATTGQNARDLLVDVPITVDKRKGVRLKWQHLYAIQDQKQKYDEVIGLAGYALAKNYVDDLLSGVTTHNFSQGAVYAAADCDLDMLNALCEAMNLTGVDPVGRTLFLSSAAATALASDSRITSKDFAGQMQGGNALRRFMNVGGFGEVIEYADFPTNNGTSLTGVTGANSGDLMTKVAHGLITGDPVTFVSGTTFTGLTAGTKYYAIKADADTFQVALTNALAVAGTAVALTADGTSGVFKKTENLVAFGFDRRAFASLAGIPDGFEQREMKAQLNIPDNMSFLPVTEPTTGITMGAVAWEDVGTGDLNWMPTLCWGKALGRQGSSAAVGAKCDYAGYRVMSA